LNGPTQGDNFIDVLRFSWRLFSSIPAMIREDRVQADLLRHIVGNPFRPPAAVHCPSHVLQLAEAQYAGNDCLFALHDALLDSGHVELAEHLDPNPTPKPRPASAMDIFSRTEMHCEDKHHPKGCWALDLILAKQ
jgi:hypothetical protein